MYELSEYLWNEHILFQASVSTLYLRISIVSAHNAYCSITFLQSEVEFLYDELYGSSVYTLMRSDRVTCTVLTKQYFQNRHFLSDLQLHQ